MAISSKLLEILACPLCKGVLAVEEDPAALVCPACLLRFPVRDEIPVMLVSEAEKIG